uniref:Uncharacterized protein n=1 Tax=Acrobeloides nanus TaxID=290746 RepID=A0A914EBT2_9BILA
MRISIDGDSKLLILLFGDSKLFGDSHPRCFKNSTIPLEYAANKTAWMTSYLDAGQELATAENQSLAELMDTQGPPKREEEAEREERGPSESHNQLSMPHSIQLPEFL